MKWLIGILAVAMLGAFGSHYFLHVPMITFLASAISLVILSKILGDATEQMSSHVGERIAGFLNVTLSNLAELIIIFVAVSANKITLVQAGIVGSIVGNLLLVMGCSIYFGCLKQGNLKLNSHTATLYINQLFLVGATLFLPTMFGSSIPEARHVPMSYIFACMLAGAYLYYNFLVVSDTRLKKVEQQAHEILEYDWSIKFSVAVLCATATGAFFMSEFLVDEVDHVAESFGFTNAFVGFIILPLLGNVAEHAVAIFAARKGMAELSLSIAVGSASQVGMIVAPCAVLFGALTGNAVTLDFSGLPLHLLIVSFIAAFIVLRDNEWNKSEGVMLIAFYIAVVIGFSFTQ